MGHGSAVVTRDDPPRNFARRVVLAALDEIEVPDADVVVRGADEVVAGRERRYGRDGA